MAEKSLDINIGKLQINAILHHMVENVDFRVTFYLNVHQN